MDRRRLGVGAGAAAVGALAAGLAGDGLPTCVGTAVLGAILPWHQRWPRVTGMLVVLTLYGSVAFRRPDVIVVAAGLNAFALARASDGPFRLIIGLLLIAGVEVRLDTNTVVPYFFFVGGPLVAGWAIRQREAITAALTQRGAELNAERDLYAKLSVRYERARIAAELHDIVAHAMSVMVVQASAGQRLAHVDPGLTEEAFDAIGAAARHAQADMERLVALLTDVDERSEDADLSLISDLVSRARALGLDVRLRLVGDRLATPGWAYRDAYLVVREGLTNAWRYASGATVDVTVRGEPGSLVVEILNAQPRTRPPWPVTAAAVAFAGFANDSMSTRAR
jgi:signal transduction histidine kinase